MFYFFFVVVSGFYCLFVDVEGEVFYVKYFIVVVKDVVVEGGFILGFKVCFWRCV